LGPKAKDWGDKVNAKAKALRHRGQGQDQGLWTKSQSFGLAKAHDWSNNANAKALKHQGQDQGQGLWTQGQCRGLGSQGQHQSQDLDVSRYRNI